MSQEPRRIAYSTTHYAEHIDQPVPDIDADPVFSQVFNVARGSTMVAKEALYSFHEAIKYVVANDVPGDIVECGVWRGGASLLAALTLKHYQAPRRRWFGRDTARKVWLYDTFDGMSAPTEHDVDLSGRSAQSYMDQYGDAGRWCYSAEDEVRTNLLAGGIGKDDFVLVKGDVLQTLAKRRPSKIAVLRLDTDWYESTKHELEVLYPLLSRGGVLIIDDYGHWNGARQATDEYFSKSRRPMLLHRTNYTVRTGVKL
jgi:hypothetical protein